MEESRIRQQVPAEPLGLFGELRVRQSLARKRQPGQCECVQVGFLSLEAPFHHPARHLAQAHLVGRLSSGRHRVHDPHTGIGVEDEVRRKPVRPVTALLGLGLDLVIEHHQVHAHIDEGAQLERPRISVRIARVVPGDQPGQRRRPGRRLHDRLPTFDRGEQEKSRRGGHRRVAALGADHWLGV